MSVHHVLPVVAAMKLTLFHVNLAIKYKSEPHPPPPPPLRMKGKNIAANKKDYD